MFETLGSYSRQTVYMSTQNGSHLGFDGTEF